MPSFSLFPRKSFMDLSSSYSASSPYSSPTSSFASGPRSTKSSVTSMGAGYEYLPPIRSPSPINLPREKSIQNFRDLDDFRDERRYLGRESLQKPLPETPISIFDRLQSPESFHPTRRAPIPPCFQSWIDLSDDEDDGSSIFSIAPLPPPPPPRAAPSPPRGPSLALDVAPGNHRIEREIMRMLQFNEEREVEKRIAQSEKKVTRRKSNLNFGGLMGKLRWSVSVRAAPEWSDNKRVSYFDYMI